MLQYLDTAIGFGVIMVLLSLLITVLVQAVVAIFGMRGTSLRWGVARLLQQLDPSLAEKAEQIADTVLRQPAVAHTGWPKSRKATAIRETELVALLEGLTEPGNEALDPEAKQSLTDALTTVRSGLSEPVNWFDTFMDRTTERFALRTRWWTIIFSFLLAVVLHIDSVDIIETLLADETLRAELVAASDGVLRQAETTLALNVEERALASKALQTVIADTSAAALIAAPGEIPPGLRTRGEGKAWIRREMLREIDIDTLTTGKRDTVQAALDTALAAYDSAFSDATKVWMEELSISARQITEQLKEANLQLIPASFTGVGPYLKDSGEKYRDAVHVVGVLLSVALLSLGAPFWYNALRKLANLRPVIANKVEAEEATTTGSTT